MPNSTGPNSAGPNSALPAPGAFAAPQAVPGAPAAPGVAPQDQRPGPDRMGMRPNGPEAFPPGRPGEFRPRGFPPAAGRIAAVDGRTLRLDGERQQPIAWTDQTTIREVVAAAAGDAAVGKCATVRPRRPDGPPNFGSAPTFAADAVTVGDAENGACEMRPGRFGPGMTGLITSASPDSLTLEMRRPEHPAAAPQAGRPSVHSWSFTVDAATEWQRLAAATGDALQVGRCATVFGDPDASGAVTAASITVRQSTDGQCLRPGGPGQAPGGPGMGQGPGGPGMGQGRGPGMGPGQGGAPGFGQGGMPGFGRGQGPGPGQGFAPGQQFAPGQGQGYQPGRAGEPIPRG
ncbi:MAG: DUF5666 domain-containing protein [Sporichthyaceae bacterium]